MLRSSLNSFLGVLSHYKSRALRTNMMYSMPCFFYYGCFDVDVLKYEKTKPIYLLVLFFFENKWRRLTMSNFGSLLQNKKEAVSKVTDTSSF